MSATTIWKDKTTNDLEQTIKSLVDEVKPDEKSSIVWGDWNIHKEFDKNKEIELGGQTIKYNYISYSYSQYYTKDLKDQSKVFKSGFIIVYSNGETIYYIVDQKSYAQKLLRKLLSYNGKNEIEKSTYSFGTDFFIWLIYRVYNSNYNIEISPDDKKLKLDAIKGFKGDTDDLQTKVTATGESVMNIISTLSFLLESNNLNQVKVDLNYSKHSNITLTLQKDTVCIDPNSYCGIFETDETSEETISKLYLMVYLEILAQLRQEYYNDIDNEYWNTNVHSDFLQQVGKKLSEKIDEKTQAIKNKKQTIAE
ncbi:MAG: hypothetical protein EGR74_00865 [Ruminiclostridium sp.]|nr:hypothetical protein [Ruminiclostridium sp.]